MPRIGHVARPGSERDAWPISGRRCKQHMSRTHGRQRDTALFRGVKAPRIPHSMGSCACWDRLRADVDNLARAGGRVDDEASLQALLGWWWRRFLVVARSLCQDEGGDIVRRPSRGWLLAAIVVGAVAVLGLAACGDDDDSAADTSSASATAEITLRLGYVTTADHPYGDRGQPVHQGRGHGLGRQDRDRGPAELPGRRRAAAAGRQGRRGRDGLGVLGGVGHPGGHLLRRPAGPRPDHPLRPREGGHRRTDRQEHARVHLGRRAEGPRHPRGRPAQAAGRQGGAHLSGGLQGQEDPHAGLERPGDRHQGAGRRPGLDPAARGLPRPCATARSTAWRRTSAWSRRSSSTRSPST